MRLLYLAGVVILAFMARDATGTRVLDSDDSNQHRVHVASTNIVSIARLLQERSVINEERAGGVFASATDKLFKSSTVTDAQFQKWLSMGETAESVFYRMKLKKNPMKLFQSPQFPRWVQYADELSASGKGAAAISVLSNKYGDDTLYRMIQLAKKQSSTDVLATRLQTEQLEHWLKIGKDPAEVFKLYDLNYAGMQILSNSQFGAWTKYVDDLNANKGVKVSIIPTLTKYYSGEDLFHIALAAKRVDETKAMGTKLEDAVFQFWIHRMITPDNVLVELGLEKSTKTLLENPLLNILIKYTEAFNVNYVRRKTTVIETLTRAFDDVTVARMLQSGRAESTTEEIAKKFQADQLEMWLNSGKSVDDVYKLLNLPPRRYLRDLGDEKLFNTWLMFINTISIKNPEKISDIFTTLTPTFLERPMMQILEAATKFPRMEKAASKLQLEMAQAVFSTGVPPPKAFELLSLDTVGDSVLSSHLFKKWMLYVEDFNKKNPADKQSWFLPLSVKYQGSRLDRIIDNAMKDPSTTNLAKMVEKEKMTEWLEKRKFSPSIAFRDLHLHKAGENVFLAPKFELWVKYLSDWNQAYPSMKTTMINGFQDNYHTFDLVSMLTAAERDPTTQKLASQLMDALADKWVAEKKTLDYVKWWLSHVSSSDDMLKRFSKKLNGE